MVESNTFSQLDYRKRLRVIPEYSKTDFNPSEIRVRNKYQIVEQNVATNPKKFVTQISVIMRVIVAAEDGRKQSEVRA